MARQILIYRINKDIDRGPGPTPLSKQDMTGGIFRYFDPITTQQ